MRGRSMDSYSLGSCLCNFKVKESKALAIQRFGCQQLVINGILNPDMELAAGICRTSLSASMINVLHHPPPLLSSLHHEMPSGSAALLNCGLSSTASSSRGRTSSISKKTIKCQAVGETSSQSQQSVVYEGVYGPWTIEPSDVREVILYRSGLVTVATSFVIGSSTAFLPNIPALSELIEGNLDLFYAVGTFGLGLSLYLIHIYVTEIKRALQALWLLGAFGSLATYASLAQPGGKNLVEYVIENPTATWFVGPLFAALTGLVFKEGLCYGKLEAGILTFIIPSVLLGHLTGLMDDGIKATLLGVWAALFVVFAGRKFYQPIKDDIGDKSVFMFNALPEEEKKVLVEKLEQQRS